MEATSKTQVEKEEILELRSVVKSLRQKIAVLEEKMAVLVLRSVGRNPLPEDLNNMIMYLADQRRAAIQAELDSKISDKVNQLIQLMIEKSETLNLKEIAKLLAAKIKDGFHHHVKDLSRNYELRLTQDVARSFDDFQKRTIQELKSEKETELNKIKTMVIQHVNGECPPSTSGASGEDAVKKLNETLNIFLRNIEKEARNTQVTNLNEVSILIQATLKEFLKMEIAEKSKAFNLEMSQIAFKRIDEKCHNDIEDLENTLNKHQEEISEQRRILLMKVLREELHTRVEEYKSNLRVELVEMIHSNSISMREELRQTIAQSLSSVIESEMSDINSELSSLYLREFEQLVRNRMELAAPDNQQVEHDGQLGEPDGQPAVLDGQGDNDDDDDDDVHDKDT